MPESLAPLSENTLEQLLHSAEQAAIAAGNAIMEFYQAAYFAERIAVAAKADDSPLTQADLAAHHLIVEHLQQACAELPILSEEDADIPYDVRQNWQRYWLIDPLDGTKEFIKRNGEFTVNIALIEKGLSLLGVVYVPAQGLMYKGWVGKGAWRNNEKLPLNPKGSVPFSEQQPLRVVVSRSHAGAEMDAKPAWLQYLPNAEHAYELVPTGSSLKFCLLAEGNADIYPRLGPTSEWDTAAAQAVLVAAGGKVLNKKGQTLLYNQKESLLNPHFIAYR